MRKILLGIFLLLSPYFFMQSASAHFYQESGPLQIQLHVIPDDTPKALEPASLEFSVYDGVNPFDLRNCSCTITVAKNGSTISSIPMNPHWLIQPQTVKVPYTFPSIGIYDIYFKGNPKTGSSFNNFSVSYLFRVDQTTSNRFLLYQKQLVIGGILLVIITTGLSWQLERNYRKTKSKKKTDE
jgi:hypothetical protein